MLLALGVDDLIVSMADDLNQLNKDKDIVFSNAPLKERIMPIIRLSTWATMTAATIVGIGQVLRQPIANSILKRQVKIANSQLSTDSITLKNALTKNQYEAAVKYNWLKPVNFGTAVENLTAERVSKNQLLDKLFTHVGGPNNPDFVGRGIFSGLNFEVTTSNANTIARHLPRPYVTKNNIIKYDMPKWIFNLFK
ncbi:MAG: hypothetical protein JEZ00_22205 [Anaerolineaceae bacterium]|nr:hypothetical protein [Anaerolineaceae bacterium]